MTTKQELVDWKNHPVTKEVLLTIKQRVRSLQEDLAGRAGIDPLQDRYMVGAIAAYSDFYFLDLDSQEENSQ